MFKTDVLNISLKMTPLKKTTNYKLYTPSLGLAAREANRRFVRKLYKTPNRIFWISKAFCLYKLTFGLAAAVRDTHFYPGGRCYSHRELSLARTTLFALGISLLTAPTWFPGPHADIVRTRLNRGARAYHLWHPRGNGDL